MSAGARDGSLEMTTPAVALAGLLLFCAAGCTPAETPPRPAAEPTDAPPDAASARTSVDTVDHAARGPEPAETPKASVQSNDWPQWRGPDRDGRSRDSGLLKRWPPGGPRLIWKATGIGAGYASIAVARGMIYTAGLIDGNMVISALDMDGEHVWRETHGPAWEVNRRGSRGTPTIHEGGLYFLSGLGLLRCYDAETASPRWQVDIAKEFDAEPSEWGYAESVLIHKDLAIVTPGGKHCIVALDKDTGRTVWRSTGLDDAPGYGSCISFTHEGVPLIAALTACGLVCVDARDGGFLWRNDRAAGDVAVCPSPVHSDGYVFAASGYGNGGVCVKLGMSAGLGDPPVSSRAAGAASPPRHGVAASTGGVRATQAWETPDMDCHHGGYVVADGHIYGNHDCGWVCLELATGKKKWDELGVGKGSICYADGMLYLFAETGGVAGLARATPDGYQETGRFSVRGKGASWAHPVVTGGRLYLRYGDNLYAYDVRDPAR